VTHELRTPSHLIRAFSEILHDNPDLDGAERSRFLSIVIRETERPRASSTRYSILPRSNRPRRMAHHRDRSQEVVEESMRRRASSTASATSRSTRAARRVPAIMRDRDRLIQVMINLLSNASKFCDRDVWTRAGGATHEHDGLRVEVIDNGIASVARIRSSSSRSPAGRRHSPTNPRAPG
jgi:signal transduction histidine kinase